jgi:hypothetical protein
LASDARAGRPRDSRRDAGATFHLYSLRRNFRWLPGVSVVTKTVVKKLARALGVVVFLALLIVVGSIAYSAWRGSIGCYFRVGGQVVVNARETSGYLHANSQKTILLLTRTDDSRPETYLVSIGPTKTVFDCGDWHPLRFLPFPVGDVNPPCTVFTVDPAKVHDPPITGTVTTGRNFVEFSTASGKRIRGQW